MELDPIRHIGVRLHQGVMTRDSEKKVEKNLPRFGPYLGRGESIVVLSCGAVRFMYPQCDALAVTSRPRLLLISSSFSGDRLTYAGTPATDRIAVAGAQTLAVANNEGEAFRVTVGSFDPELIADAWEECQATWSGEWNWDDLPPDPFEPDEAEELESSTVDPAPEDRGEAQPGKLAAGWLVLFAGVAWFIAGVSYTNDNVHTAPGVSLLDTPITGDNAFLGWGPVGGLVFLFIGVMLLLEGWGRRR